MTALARGSAAGVVALSLCLAALSASTAQAQDAKSVALAKQLATALTAAKLDSIAARDPAAPDVFIGALYFPGQLLVISAKYSVPAYLTERLGNKQYRDVYLDLNGASVASTKVFFQDAGADGLRADRNGDQPFDTYDHDGKQIAFDADWKKQKLSKDDYLKEFATADERYSQMLQALLAELKKPS
jgi:hypothetical protein